jgi:hypothetical protein
MDSRVPKSEREWAAAREIERLQGLLQEQLSCQGQEIEQLRQQVTQRGARMQVMWEYLTQYSSGSAALWRDFLRTKPQAADWFDADGVPK